jgi:hypothetical protein
MSGMKQYKRKAAGKVFLFVFASMSNLHFQLTFNHLEWGEDIFSLRERELIGRLRERMHAEAELCRQIGQRLSKS